LAEVGALPHLGDLPTVPQDGGGAAQDHEQGVTGFAFDDEIPVGRERRRLHVARDRAPLARRAAREEPDGLEGVSQVPLAAHSSLLPRSVFPNGRAALYGAAAARLW